MPTEEELAAERRRLQKLTAAAEFEARQAQAAAEAVVRLEDKLERVREKDEVGEVERQLAEAREAAAEADERAQAAFDAAPQPSGDGGSTAAVGMAGLDATVKIEEH